VTPHAGEILAGPTTMEVEVGEPAAGTQVQFFVDDKPAGSATAPPFRASFDFGDSLAAHTLRAVVTEPTGRSFAVSLTTRAMGRPDDVSRVDLVNLYVTVRDTSNRLVQGLAQTSFRISENGKPQTISHFSNERQRLV